MISVTSKLTPEKFLKIAGPKLEQKEVQNNLILGIAHNIALKPADQRQEHYFWVVKSNGAVEGAAFWTPPYKLSLTEMEPEALFLLARKVKKSFPNIPGVNGPKEILPTFIRAWNTQGLHAVLETSFGLYRVDKVEKVPPAPGALRPAQSTDIDLLTQLHQQFRTEIRATEEINERELVDGYIREGRLFVWEYGQICAMAGYAGSGPRGMRITMVYTPPSLRKRGFASNLVAALSQNLLDSGKKFCVLYTDLLNPTSNSIYRKIGYQPVCDWDNYSFQMLDRLF